MHLLNGRLYSVFQGGSEMSSMQMELGRCFLEGEQDRIQQENLEKKQAEQVAAGMHVLSSRTTCTCTCNMVWVGCM